MKTHTNCVSVDLRPASDVQHVQCGQCYADGVICVPLRKSTDQHVLITDRLHLRNRRRLGLLMTMSVEDNNMLHHNRHIMPMMMMMIVIAVIIIPIPLL